MENILGLFQENDWFIEDFACRCWKEYDCTNISVVITLSHSSICSFFFNYSCSRRATSFFFFMVFALFLIVLHLRPWFQHCISSMLNMVRFLNEIRCSAVYWSLLSSTAKWCYGWHISALQKNTLIILLQTDSWFHSKWSCAV